ncbi:hypothetical protein SUDANB70_03495 [Streptomyces sp. enrichment culture]
MAALGPGRPLRAGVATRRNGPGRTAPRPAHRAYRCTARAANDYGPKKAAYATAGIPLYVIADPYLGRCFVYTDPKNGDYVTRTRVDFGDDIDLTGTVADLTLPTDGFPRD